MNDTCSIDGCNLGETSDAIRRGFCELHYYRYQKYGDPHKQTKILNKRGGEVTRYATAHHRLLKARGRAKDHACEHCGKRAYDWAYDGEDPHERVDSVDGKRVFSNNYEHYHPLCRSCHRKLDWDRYYVPNYHRLNEADLIKATEARRERRRKLNLESVAVNGLRVIA